MNVRKNNNYFEGQSSSTDCMKFNWNKWVWIAVLAVIHSTTMAQKAYLETDSLILQGIKIIHGDERRDAQVIHAEIKGDVKKFTPEDLKGFRMEDGTTFVTKEISFDEGIKKVFVRLLQKGKINLYMYSEKGVKRYFLEKKESDLMELGDEFRNVLSSQMQDCNWISEAIKISKLKKTSLSKLVSIYNDNEPVHYPFLKLGLTGGYVQAKLDIPSKLRNRALENMSFDQKSSWMFGITMDVPILRSNYSILTGFSLSQKGFTGNDKNAFSDIDAVINISSFEIPLLVRYTTSNVNVRWFAETGITTNVNYKNTNELYSARIDGNVIFINEKSEEPMLSSTMYALTLGTGIQLRLGARMTMSFGTRFDRFFGSELSLSMGQLKFFSSITF